MQSEVKYIPLHRPSHHPAPLTPARPPPRPIPGQRIQILDSADDEEIHLPRGLRVQPSPPRACVSAHSMRPPACLSAISACRCASPASEENCSTAL